MTTFWAKLNVPECWRKLDSTLQLVKEWVAKSPNDLFIFADISHRSWWDVGILQKDRGLENQRNSHEIFSFQSLQLLLAENWTAMAFMFIYFHSISNLYIFYLIFHCGFYFGAVSITDNLCKMKFFNILNSDMIQVLWIDHPCMRLTVLYFHIWKRWPKYSINCKTNNHSLIP